MFSSTHQFVLAAILACAGVVAFINCQNKIKAGFLLFIGTLGLGYRTLPITSVLRLHPGEFAIWGVLILVLAQNTPGRKEQQRSLPWWFWGLVPWWIYAWLQASKNHRSLDEQFAEFRNFLHLIPIFVVIASILKGTRTAAYASRQQGRPFPLSVNRGVRMNRDGESDRQAAWRFVILALYVVSTGIALMGVLEYYVPGFRSLLPGLMTAPRKIEGEGEEFLRAAFSFWGSPAAAFTCGLIVPMTPLVLRWWPNQKAYTFGAFFLQLVAIYIAGWRSLWLFTGVQFLLFMAAKKRFVLGVAIVLGLFLFYGAIVPSKTQERLQSLLMVLEGKPIDSDTSGQKRWDLAMNAMYGIEEAPLGQGWAMAGWVHSDFIQIAANQGIIAGATFLAGYLVTLGLLIWRWRKTAAGEEAEIGLALLLTFVEIGGILVFEGFQVLPQLIFPLWVGWALVEAWLKQQRTARPVAISRGMDRRRRVRQRSYRPRSLALTMGV